MCYKIPHAWSCGHNALWSYAHCTTATAHGMTPEEHCDHLMAAGDPERTVKEGMPCPDCQRKGESSSSSSSEGEDEQDDGGEKHEDEKPGMNASASSLARELATLEHELRTLELADLETALQESSRQHAQHHARRVEEAKQRSLAEAPMQSIEEYASDLQAAREESRRHWEEELGMGVYADHEEAVQRARVESYRGLLEGYRRLRNGEGGSGDGEVGEAVASPVPIPESTSPRCWRWPSHDEGHRELYEDDDDGDNDKNNAVPVSSPSKSSSYSSARHFRQGAAAVDPAESFLGRRPTTTSSHGQHEAEQPPPPPAAAAAAGAGVNAAPVPQERRRSRLLKKIRPGGGSSDKKP